MLMAYGLLTHWGPLVRAVYGVNDGILAARLHATNLVQIGVEVYVPILKTCFIDQSQE